MKSKSVAAVVATLVAMLSSCRSTPVGPYAPMSEVARSTTKAEELNREGADLIASDPARAEALLLRDALTADLYFGPAHNNLGVVFLNAGKLYEAANEFEWARKLMPGHPDPRVNLGICLERAGRVDDALESYDAALQVSPGYLPAIQGATLAAIHSGRDDARLTGWLHEIAMRAEGEGWKSWRGSGLPAQRNKPAHSPSDYAHGIPTPGIRRAKWALELDGLGESDTQFTVAW
ncbi:MAG: tetratricopeptide repeat protein [Sandaracinaceae bacterium]|nr:tetratricopeptide repeat protein [Sandaracinaceae bacterium]